MIRELIVVEGFHDVSAVRQAVEAELLTTNGFVLNADTLATIQKAQDTCGVIILTDPDPVGEQIRRRIEEAVGPCKHAHLAREDCLAGTDIGVENARPDVIREALSRARATQIPIREEFGVRDLWEHGLQGVPEARDRRIRLGAALSVGYANSRQLLRRMNHLGVTREEFEAAVAGL